MLDSFETANEIVICTEYVYSDLHKLLAKEGSIGEVRARKLTFDLVSALYYLHSHRILHRDLKPQVNDIRFSDFDGNIFVNILCSQIHRTYCWTEMETQNYVISV